MTKIQIALPLVTADDDGIRPAGSPDACLYCGRKVGERHLFDCVIFTTPRTYRVILDGADVGTWTREDPASWDVDMREFHKNESSWCANNLRHEGTLSVTEQARTALLTVVDPDACELCPRVGLRPVDGEPEYEEAP